MKTFLSAFLFLFVSLLNAQTVGQFTIPLKTSSTGPATPKHWTKGNLTLWGTDASGNPVSYTLGAGARFENGELIIEGGEGGGSGTVTSVAASGGTTGFAFTGSPITGSGTLTLTISNAATVRSQLGLGTLATQSGTLSDYLTTAAAAAGYQPLSAALTTIAGNGSAYYLARSNHTGTQAWSTITSTPTTLAGYGISDGITAAAVAADYQPVDSDLTSIAALATTSYGRSLLAAADDAALRTLAGTIIGTHVQAYDADLADLADGTLSGSKVGTGIDAGNITAGTLGAGRLPLPGVATLGGVMRNTGSGGQFVTGIQTDGSLIFGTPSGSGDVMGPGVEVTLNELANYAATDGGTLGPSGVIATAGDITAASLYLPGSDLDYTMLGSTGLTIQRGNVTASASVVITVDPSGSSYTLTLPPAAGTSGQVLGNDGTGKLVWETLSGGGDALTSDTLAQFADTTSAQLRGVISDENGTGALIFAGGNLGAATATSINGLTITTSTGTLTLANGKTFTSSNTLTLAGTDGSTLNIGTGGTLGTAAYTAATAYQAASAELTTIAGNGSAYYLARGNHTGTQAWSTITSTPTTLAGYGISDGITAAAVAAGYQPVDSDLTSIAALATTSYGRSLLAAADDAALRTLAGTIIGTHVQAYDADLADLADGSLTGSKVSAATTSAVGVVELATDGETASGVAVQGNDTRLANASKVEIGVALSDETTAVTAGTAKVTFRLPHAMTLTAVRASATTAPTGSTLVIDINEAGSTVLSTKLSLDASEKTSTTAASAAVISDASLADDAEITFDLDQVGSTIAGAGIKVWLIGTR